MQENQTVTGAVEGGATGQRDAMPEQTHEQIHRMPPYPPGLTTEGLARFQELSAENQYRYARGLDCEMTRQWLDSNHSGPETHTREQVEQAAAAMRAKERQTIIEEVTPLIRAELAKELRNSHRTSSAARKRPRGLRWLNMFPRQHKQRIGLVMANACTTAVALTLPTESVWVKAAILASSIISSLLVSAQR
jgi:hypothetical protein